MTKKEQLAASMIAERDRLPDVNEFGEKTDFEGIDLAIRYLYTGEYNKSDVDKHDVLYEVVENFDETYECYCE